MRCRLILLLLWVLGAAVCSDKALIRFVHEKEVMTLIKKLLFNMQRVKQNLQDRKIKLKMCILETARYWSDTNKQDGQEGTLIIIMLICRKLLSLYCGDKGRNLFFKYVKDNL